MLGGLALLVAFVATLWGVELVNGLLLGHGLNDYGLSPLALPYRGLSNWELSASYLLGSVRGILLSPLLHGSFSHLLSNTLTLIPLGVVVAARGAKTLAGVSLFVVVWAVCWCGWSDARRCMWARAGWHSACSAIWWRAAGMSAVSCPYWLR